MKLRFWENRESGGQSPGNYSDAIVRLLESAAANKTIDASSTAAVEAAAGALSRAFMAAEVSGPTWALKALNPVFLGQVGRDLIRSGSSMHRMDIDGMGMLKLTPSSQWYFTGPDHETDWTVQVTTYGPSGSTTRYIPYAGVVFIRWGSRPGTPYLGVGPTSWATTTARLQAESERSLADESGGPLAQLLPIPMDGLGDQGDNVTAPDPLAMLRADIRGARGKALLLETTSAGYGEGREAAPKKDWIANRLGPQPPESMVQLRSDAFEAVLAATGTPPSLFLDSDGTAQREAVRRWHMGTVEPLAKMLEWELSEKLETPIRLDFDGYPKDLAGRAATFQKLVAGGMSMNEAMTISGLMLAD